MRRNKGFTLVELLVVIGIIAVLISILLPTLNRVRLNAMQIKCAANLRTCGQFYAMYAASFNGKYPTAPGSGTYVFGDFGGTASPSGQYYGIGPASLVISGFVKNPSLLYCPAREQRSDDGLTGTSFTYTQYEPAWNKKQYNAVYTNYTFWAGYPFNATAKPTSRINPATGAEFFPFWLPNWFTEAVALNARSRGDTVLGSDMTILTTKGYLLRSNHSDHKMNVVPDQTGTLNKVEFYGGNTLYNDGHVVWKDKNEVKPALRFPGNNNYILFYF